VRETGWGYALYRLLYVPVHVCECKCVSVRMFLCVCVRPSLSISSPISSPLLFFSPLVSFLTAGVGVADGWRWRDFIIHSSIREGSTWAMTICRR
jgi:hypothetical protein